MLLMPILRLVLLLAVLSLSTATFAAHVSVSDPAPDFVLKSLAGKNLRLSEYRGETVLVTFWASWCGRCRDQLAELDNLFASYREQGLRLLSVNIDDDETKARAAVGELGLQFPVLFDDQKVVARRYDLGNLPLTLIIDPSGEVRYLHEGYSRGDENNYQRELEVLISE
jgi:peroxiredoxin